jgi:hypothetical protein
MFVTGEHTTHSSSYVWRWSAPLRGALFFVNKDFAQAALTVGPDCGDTVWPSRSEGGKQL